MAVKDILAEKLNAVGDEVLKTYIAPDIPEKKLQNALKFIASGIDASDVIGLVDGTLFGTAKDGLVFTETTFFSRYGNESASFDYQKIKKVEVEEKKLLVYDEMGVIYTETALYNFRKLGELLLALANKDKQTEKVATTEEKAKPNVEQTEAKPVDEAQDVTFEDKGKTEKPEENISGNLKNAAKNFVKSSFFKNNIGGLIVAAIMIVLFFATNLEGSEDAFPIGIIILGAPFALIMGCVGWALARKLRDSFAPDVIFYTETSTLIFKKFWWGCGIYLLCSAIGAAVPMSILQMIAKAILGE